MMHIIAYFISCILLVISNVNNLPTGNVNLTITEQLIENSCGNLTIQIDSNTLQIQVTAAAKNDQMFANMSLANVTAAGLCCYHLFDNNNGYLLSIVTSPNTILGFLRIDKQGSYSFPNGTGLTHPINDTFNLQMDKIIAALGTSAGPVDEILMIPDTPLNRGSAGSSGKVILGSGTTANRILQIHVVADQSIYAIFTTNMLTYIVAVVTNVNAMYMRDANVQIQMISHDIWSSNNLASVTSVMADTLLNLAYYKYTTPTITANVIHMMTHTDYGSTVGLAYLGGACSDYAASMSSNIVGNLLYHSIIMTHELGHNQGLVHIPPVCQCPGYAYCIMQAVLPSSLQASAFSDCDKAQLNASWITNSLTCLDATPFDHAYGSSSISLKSYIFLTIMAIIISCCCFIFV